jgi:hypothetical protein
MVACLAVLAPGVMATSACGNLLSAEDAFYTVAVDSITGPDTVLSKSTYTQRLWGPVGSNGCASINRLFIRPGSSATEIQVQGRHTTGNCTQMPVYMAGEPVTLTAPAATGDHVIRILRPGVSLTKTVVVK